LGERRAIFEEIATVCSGVSRAFNAGQRQQLRYEDVRESQDRRVIGMVAALGVAITAWVAISIWAVYAFT
jgi:hypothetical protein